MGGIPHPSHLHHPHPNPYHLLVGSMDGSVACCRVAGSMLPAAVNGGSPGDVVNGGSPGDVVNAAASGVSEALGGSVVQAEAPHEP